MLWHLVTVLLPCHVTVETFKWTHLYYNQHHPDGDYVSQNALLFFRPIQLVCLRISTLTASCFVVIILSFRRATWRLILFLFFLPFSMSTFLTNFFSISSITQVQIYTFLVPYEMIHICPDTNRRRGDPAGHVKVFSRPTHMHGWFGHCSAFCVTAEVQKLALWHLERIDVSSCEHSNSSQRNWPFLQCTAD